MSPYFKFFWKAASWCDRTTCKIKAYRFPRQRCTWCFIGAAVVLAAALSVSLVLLNQHSHPQAAKCYAKGTFDGLDVYLATNHTTMESCDSAAKGSGLTNLSSLPPGLQQVCTGTNGITVYMTPVQLATVRDLGVNPSVICS